MNPFAEIAILQDHFAAEKCKGEALSVRLAATKRDEQDLDGRLNYAARNGMNTRPIMSEVRENLLDQAQVMTEFAEHATRMANLHKQSAAAIQKIIQQ